MSEYEEDFIPHTRDEQSEQPLDLLPFEDAPLEDALRRHYQLTARQSARTLEQARKRILQSRWIGSTQASPSGNISQFSRTKNERTSHMFVNNSAPGSTSKFPRLSVIAAGLIAVLVVGSMLGLIAATHPFGGGTTIVASGSTSSQVSSKPVTISGQGIIYPNQEQNIQYSTGVQVTAVFVQAGDQVKPGQVLMQIVSGRIISQIQLAQAKLQAAQALLKQDTANVNRKHITEDQQQITLVQSELQQLQQQVNAMQGSNVTSSIAGVVTQVNVDSDIVAANTPILTVMDESTVVVHAEVPLTFMGQVRMHQVVTVTTSGLSGRIFKGTIIKIPAADPETHTFEAWVSIPNSTKQLLAGMSAQIQIQIQTK